ncbi:hypothetical protein G6O69_04680 [Pseudenhygromyxa sp. WMMC2535]|uniref:hypothetical protein n=1 Tax=Pseudenhygromyxa sp. WMMC2535 TaxID=2712867 RepID=UPI001595FEAF|nr:hypothetical protein [Pseudenhygromyxa sp. WMMC2535]NVB37114.1 hypothetical protein [Pseudenhygromyxa sp. WMMC2535]
MAVEHERGEPSLERAAVGVVSSDHGPLECAVPRHLEQAAGSGEAQRVELSGPEHRSTGA